MDLERGDDWLPGAAPVAVVCDPVSPEAPGVWVLLGGIDGWWGGCRGRTLPELQRRRLVAVVSPSAWLNGAHLECGQLGRGELGRGCGHQSLSAAAGQSLLRLPVGVQAI